MLTVWYVFFLALAHTNLAFSFSFHVIVMICIFKWGFWVILKLGELLILQMNIVVKPLAIIHTNKSKSKPLILWYFLEVVKDMMIAQKKSRVLVVESKHPNELSDSLPSRCVHFVCSKISILTKILVQNMIPSGLLPTGLARWPSALGSRSHWFQKSDLHKGRKWAA